MTIRKGDKLRVRKGWNMEGTRMTAVADEIHLAQDWVAVVCEDDSEPELFKSAALERY